MIDDTPGCAPMLRSPSKADLTPARRHAIRLLLAAHLTDDQPAKVTVQVGRWLASFQLATWVTPDERRMLIRLTGNE